MVLLVSKYIYFISYFISFQTETKIYTKIPKLGDKISCVLRIRFKNSFCEFFSSLKKGAEFRYHKKNK